MRPAQKQSRLPALTGIRTFAALNLVFFHFSNPSDFGWFAPIIEHGYSSVSFFLLLSGFILAYNYSDRATEGKLRAKDFWLARISRLYPVYLVSLVISLGMLRLEFHARSLADFLTGTGLTMVLLQGWSPTLSTFWNTPAWTMSTEVFFYLLFPFIILWKRPASFGKLLLTLLLIWLAGMLCPALYTALHPDGILHPDRYSDGWWLRGLKFTPLPHLPSFLFGVVLAELNNRFPEHSRWRLWLGLAGSLGIYLLLAEGRHLPYVFLHDGLLMPLFALLILGLAGQNGFSRIFAFVPFVLLGEASYCMYLMHFNLWTLIHQSGVLKSAGLDRFDPWVSYVLLILGAMATMLLIERPGQRWIRSLLVPARHNQPLVTMPAGLQRSENGAALAQDHRHTSSCS